MGRENSKRRPLGVSVTGVLTLLLLVMCLAEGATEQRINSRGSKATKLIQKVNGWRSQRGGSCLSYGHSCWGAHGKRSGKPPATAPDWFLAKLFRHIDANGELERPRQNLKNDDSSIYQGNVPEDTTSNRHDSDEDIPVDPAANRNPEAKPMLDDELLSKIRLWQIMRDVTEDQ